MSELKQTYYGEQRLAESKLRQVREDLAEVRADVERVIEMVKPVVEEQDRLRGFVETVANMSTDGHGLSTGSTGLLIKRAREVLAAQGGGDG